MQIFRRLAGYSLGMADIVRRAISKKKDDVMKSERHSFLYGKTDETGNVLCEGALKHGIALQTAEKIFDNMASFAAYAFNKAHAACYGIIAYRTAWLKANYPAEYMTALLSSVVGDDAKTAAYIAEAKRLGLQVLPPDVNESGAYFTFHKKTVRFPLSGIRNVGMAFAQEVEAEREQGPFLSLTDFCQRMAERKLNKRLLECLIFAGAADSLGGNRAQLLAVYENVFDSVADAQRRSVEGQMDLFSGFMGEAEEVRAPAPVPLPVIEEMPKARLLELEREYTGLYWSGNPFAPYEQSALNRQCMGIATALEAEDESRVKTAGLLSSVRVRKSKKGNRVGSAVLTDANGQVELLAFAGVLEQYEAFWQDGLAVAVTGRLQSNDEGPARILVNALEMLREEEKDNRAPAREAQENSTASARKLSHPPGIYVRLESAEDPRLAKVKALCRIFEGNDPLYVFFAKSKTTVLVNHVRTSVCPELLAELREAVGEENVRVFGK